MTSPQTDPLALSNISKLDLAKECVTELGWIDCDDSIFIPVGDKGYRMLSKVKAVAESDLLESCLLDSHPSLPALIDKFRQINAKGDYNPLIYVCEWLDISDKIRDEAPYVHMDLEWLPYTDWEIQQAQEQSFEELTHIYLLAKDLEIPRLSASLSTIFKIKGETSKTLPSLADITLIYQDGNENRKLKATVIKLYGSANSRLQDAWEEEIWRFPREFVEGVFGRLPTVEMTMDEAMRRVAVCVPTRQVWR